MRRNAPLVTLVVTQIVVALLAAAFHLGARAAIARAFAAEAAAPPRTAALALSTWFIPAATLFGLVACVVAVLAPLRRSRRNATAATGVVVSSFALVFAALAAFAPLLRPVP